MLKPISARHRFAAALALFLAWVAALAVMAATSSNRPPTHLISADPAPDGSVTESPTH